MLFYDAQRKYLKKLSICKIWNIDKVYFAKKKQFFVLIKTEMSELFKNQSLIELHLSRLINKDCFLT